jgi:hypothetical protein
MASERLDANRSALNKTIESTAQRSRSVKDEMAEIDL